MPPSENLDPGIASTVAWLNERGFRTCDSGDGVSKEPDPSCVLPYPHVVISLDDPATMVAEADRLADALQEAGYHVENIGPSHVPYLAGGHFSIQASYDPVGESALVELMGRLPDAG